MVSEYKYKGASVQYVCTVSAYPHHGVYKLARLEEYTPLL